MTAALRTRSSLRFRGRSFLALVLAPEPPTEAWFAEIDTLLMRSPGFFVGRPVILDVSALPLDKASLADLVAELNRRDIHLMGIEGAKSAAFGPGLPPLIASGRQTAEIIEAPGPAGTAAAAAAPAPIAAPTSEPRPASLLLDSPVRSGQSVNYPAGDVIVIGSVASGAEVVAGGSIHVYGALRGRAIAGSAGDAKARIFCGRMEAELLVIDGLYRTADEIEAQLRGRAVQVWLDGEAMMMAGLN